MHVMSMIPVKEVGVYIEGDADATVAELLLNVFHVRPLLDEETREGMTEIVKAYLPQARRGQLSIERLTEHLIGHSVALRRQEHPVRRRGVALHTCVQLPCLSEPFEFGLQLRREIDTPDLSSLRRGFLSTHHIVAHLDKVAVKIDVIPP